MDRLRILTKIYGIHRNYPYVPIWILTPTRRIIRLISNYILPSYLDKKSKYSGIIQKGLIASLTSFPERINDVWKVIECLMRQTLVPEKIILWLSKDQFPSENHIPLSLRKRMNDIFEIRLVEGDIRSHKKYYYSFKEYYNYLILLVDDDIYYSPTMVEELYNTYLATDGRRVICSFAIIQKDDENGNRLPYMKWDMKTYQRYNTKLFLGTGGGTLINPRDLFEDTMNFELFLKLTPTADDIWINAMCRLNNVKLIWARFDLYLPIIISNNKTLKALNNGLNQNDIQIDAVNNYYLSRLGQKPF